MPTPAAPATVVLPYPTEEAMDEEELRTALGNIQGRANAAIGEGLFTAAVLGPLMILLVRRGVISKTETTNLIDAALLGLEERHHPAATVDQAAIDHARGRLESLLAILRANPGRSSSPG
jgi:hypothetical protein